MGCIVPTGPMMCFCPSVCPSTLCFFPDETSNRFHFINFYDRTWYEFGRFESGIVSLTNMANMVGILEIWFRSITRRLFGLLTFNLAWWYNLIWACYFRNRGRFVNRYGRNDDHFVNRPHFWMITCRYFDRLIYNLICWYNMIWAWLFSNSESFH